MAMEKYSQRIRYLKTETRWTNSGFRYLQPIVPMLVSNLNAYPLKALPLPPP